MGVLLKAKPLDSPLQDQVQQDMVEVNIVDKLPRLPLQVATVVATTVKPPTVMVEAEEEAVVEVEEPWVEVVMENHQAVSNMDLAQVALVEAEAEAGEVPEVETVVEGMVSEEVEVLRKIYNKMNIFVTYQ